jgi:hypothetical protein
MAVNDLRSMNKDLREGITDGVVKKINPNRGGFPNDDHCFQMTYGTLSQDLYDPVTGVNPAQAYHAERVVSPIR